MAKFIKPFKGVKDGDIYHTQFHPDDECPQELEAAAKSVGAVPDGKKPADPKSKG